MPFTLYMYEFQLNIVFNVIIEVIMSYNIISFLTIFRWKVGGWVLMHHIYCFDDVVRSIYDIFSTCALKISVKYANMY